MGQFSIKEWRFNHLIMEKDNWKTVKTRSGDTLKPGKKYTMPRYDGEITFIKFDRDNKTMHLKSNKIGKIRTSIFNARDMVLNEDYMKDLEELDKGDIVIDEDGDEWTIEKIRWWLGSPDVTLRNNTDNTTTDFPEDFDDPNFFANFNLKESVNEKYEDHGWRLEINPTRGGISPDALRKKLTAAGIDFEEERKNRWQILAPKDGSGSSEAKRLLDMNRFDNYKIYESVNEGSSRIKDLLKHLEWALKYSKMKTTKPGYRAWAGPPTPPRKLYNDHLTDINDYTYTKLSKELGIFRDIEKALKDKKMNPRAIDKIIKKVKASPNESVNEAKKFSPLEALKYLGKQGHPVKKIKFDRELGGAMSFKVDGKVIGRLNNKGELVDLKESVNEGTSDDLVKRIGDLEDMLWNGNNRRAEKEWEIVSGEYLPGDQYGSDQYPGPEHWDKLEDHDLRSAIDDAEHIMKKYNIREL